MSVGNQSLVNLHRLNIMDVGTVKEELFGQWGRPSFSVFFFKHFLV